MKRPVLSYFVIYLLILIIKNHFCFIDMAWSMTLQQSMDDCIHGNGKIVKVSRTVNNFSKIIIDGVFEVKIVSNGYYSMSIETDKNIEPLIKTIVDNNSLRIYTSRSICTSSPILINISLPELKSAEVNGSVDMNIEKIRSNNFSAIVRGASDVIFNGNVNKATLKIYGSGDVDASNLKAQVVEITVDGSADAKVYASKSLKVKISGTGTVQYLGEPKHIEKHITGVGSLEEF